MKNNQLKFWSLRQSLHATSRAILAGGVAALALLAMPAQAKFPSLAAPAQASSAQGFAQCKHLFPKSTPIDATSINRDWLVTGLCSNHFAVLHSGLSKTPLVVVERLNSALLADAQGEGRTNEFFPDTRLPSGQRSEIEDFKRSGLDRGHLASAADQPDQESMIQSFALSNMVPQDPINNRQGAWVKAEIDTRKYVKRATGNVFVFSGPLFLGDVKKIGRNQVWVPSHLFKLVYDESTGRSWAHLIENTASARIQAPMSYSEFVQKTGWNLLK
jgi:endonuclease G, mitochondrial